MKIEIGNGGVGSSIAVIFVVGFFIPPIWPVLAVIGIVMWIMGLVAKHQIAQIPESAKMLFNAPTIQSAPSLPSIPALPAPPAPVEVALSDEEVDEKIQAAVAEAKRIANLTRCSHEGRKRIFERVFRRECEKQGVKADKIIWKTQ